MAWDMWKLVREFYQAAKEDGFVSAVKQAILHVSTILLKLISERLSNIRQKTKFKIGDTVKILEKVRPKSLIGSDKIGKISWILPTFNKGSGGHTTIFRFAKYFELMGLTNHFIIRNASKNVETLHADDALLKEMYQYFYASLNCSISTYDVDGDLLDRIDEIDADIVIGTDMFSQLIALGVEKANRRLHFLQDDESRFQPAGPLAAFMNAHFSREDAEFICAGKWLASIVDARRSFTFDLGVDSLRALVLRETSKRTSRQNSKIKIALYSRVTTERRCVDLALAYLDGLHRSGEDFELHTFGLDRLRLDFPFPTVDHGVLSPNGLYRLLLECDICMALSATNYSLLPNEAAALGAIAVDLDTPSNRMVYTHERIKLIGPEVSTAVAQLQDIIVQCRKDPGSSGQLSLDESYAEDLAWVSQQRSIYQALFGKGQPDLMKVSVCIPTRNAGPLFELLLFALQKQALVELELCIIDTESEDQTLDLAYKYFPDAKIEKITKAEFGHGKTRNRLAEMASHEHIVFLTQDAIPLDELLLVSLAKHVDKDPLICGSFCSHVTYPFHSRFRAHSMEKHFEGLAKSFSARNFAADASESLKYRFFSTNCALIKRSLLLAHPFDNVIYGEDQVWAAQMLRKGFGTAFVPEVSIMHSHDYDGDELVAMTRTDLEFHKVHFGAFANWSKESLDKNTDKIAAEIGASMEEIERQKQLNVLKMRGYELAKQSDEVSYSK